MELRHLRYFVAVAEELHFGRAAERLFMAQPPLSQQIKHLEQEIGAVLLDRTNRRVALSAAGSTFLGEARAILAQVDNAVAKTQRVARGEAGWLGIGFVGSATYDVLPDILRTFRRDYPGVELVLLELLGAEQGQALQEGQIHVGFARLPGHEDGIVLETVTQEPLIVALPSLHPLAMRNEIALAELALEPFIMFPRPVQSRYADFVIGLCRAAGFTPRVIQETGEIQTAVSLVAAGIGVAVVPGAVQNLHREGVVYRSLAAPAPVVELTMAYRENDTSPVLPHFLEIVRANNRE